MAKIERADRKAIDDNPEVRLNGRAIDFGERRYDAATFARTLRKRMNKPKTMAEREAKQRAMEAKCR